MMIVWEDVWIKCRIIDSNQKEYPLEQVKVTLDNEELFNSLVTEMVAI